MSRQHAVIESTPDGVPAARYRQRQRRRSSPTERQSEVALAHGLQFGIGDTVFEFVAPPAEPEPRPRAGEFVIRIVESTAADAHRQGIHGVGRRLDRPRRPTAPSR